MTPPGDDDVHGRTRRSVLRTVGAAAGAGLASTGVTAADGDEAEEDRIGGRCPHPHEYWADADWPATVSDPFTLCGRTMSVDRWRRLLRQPDGEDVGEALAKRLLATVLNLHHRWPDDPTCTDQPIEELHGDTIRDVKADAYRWLNWSAFPDGDEQRHWLVNIGYRYADGEPVAAALERFNRGGFESLDCGCTDAASRGGIFLPQGAAGRGGRGYRGNLVPTRR